MVAACSFLEKNCNRCVKKCCVFMQYVSENILTEEANMTAVHADTQKTINLH